MKFGLSYQPPGATPLPWKQILVLCGVRLAEPINFSLIFPFINEMIVEQTGVKVEDVGFYSGLVEGIFAFVQFCAVYTWGSLSDRWGRRPIILMGLLGVAVSGTSFGLSKSFWMMCLTRSMNGLLCGNVVAVKASLGEITDETNQGVAFPVYGLTWVIGTVLGSTIGGYLSHPAERIPSLFGESAFLKEYPFFLPCGLSGCISICGFVFAFIFLEETLEKPSITPPPSYSSSMEDYESLELLPSPATPQSSSSEAPFLPPHRRSSSSVSFGGGRRAEEEWSFLGLLKLPLVKRVVLSTFLMSMIAGSFGAVNLLVFYSPIAEGGLGMSASQTGTSLALNGIWTLLSQIAFLPPLQVAFGIATLYHYLNAGWIFIFFLLPFLNHLAIITGSTDSSEVGGGLSLWVWLAVAITLMMSTVFNMASSISMILINTATPSKSALGKLNGITQMAGSLARSVGPAFVSSLFALSQSRSADGKKPMGGHLWWMAMVALAVISGTVGFMVKEGNGAKKKLEVIFEEEEEMVGGVDEEEGGGTARAEGALGAGRGEEGWGRERKEDGRKE